MEFLKKPKTAVAVLVAVVIVFSLIGVNLSVARQADKVGGVFDERLGIGFQLEEQRKAAMSLYSFGAGIDAVSEEYDALRSAASLEAETMDEKYEAFLAIGEAYPAFVKKLSESDAQYNRDAVESLARTLDGAESAISKSGYNSAVMSFYSDVLGVFPVNVLRPIIFCDMPEYFGPVK